MLACYDREILMENGLFLLPRGASELVRQTDFIIQVSCNCKFKDRLEPCITEHGLRERTTLVPLFLDTFSYKITLCEWLRKYNSEPSDYFVSFVNRTVLSALSWHNSSPGAGGKNSTKIGLSTVVPFVDRWTKRRIATSVPHFHLQSDLHHSLQTPKSLFRLGQRGVRWNSSRRGFDKRSLICCMFPCITQGISKYIISILQLCRYERYRAGRWHCNSDQQS